MKKTKKGGRNTRVDAEITEAIVSRIKGGAKGISAGGNRLTTDERIKKYINIHKQDEKAEWAMLKDKWLGRAQKAVGIPTFPARLVTNVPYKAVEGALRGVVKGVKKTIKDTGY